MADRESELETKTDAILEYSVVDFNRKMEEVRKKAAGEIETFDYDVTPLKGGKTMYYVMVRYQVKRSDGGSE